MTSSTQRRTTAGSRMEEVEAIPDPVQRAVAADAAMWEVPGQASRAREIRREALRQALDCDVPVHLIAGALGVREEDVPALAQAPVGLGWLPPQPTGSGG
jgi:hypothetical protein